MNVLVTGGAGFIGSNLVGALAGDGHPVRVLDDLSTGRKENLDGVAGNVEVVLGDVRDRALVRGALDGVEVVFHLAALPSVARSVADPRASHEVNVDGTLNVLLAAGDAGVRRLVYASSSSEYGDTPVLPKHEEMPVSPRSPYAAAKLAGEAYCRAFSHVYPLETVCLRFFNVFGPRQDPASQYAAVVPRFVTRMLAGRPAEVTGDGRQTRDFTFVANAVEACRLAASAGPEAVGQAMNVGCADRISVLDLVGLINDLLGQRLDPVFTPARPGDVRDSQASTDKAKRLIGYRPLVPVREGLAATVRWFAGAPTTTTTTEGVAPR
ncbi:MAG TPA: SDR family oxidoreductase [Actinomycetes bacterium]|nr:SDR family oxidoreductase [Actinomycetes bacterium]